MIDASEALKIYFISHPRAIKHIKWIMNWDDKLTLSENTKSLRIPNQPSATNFRYLYKLGCRKGYNIIARTNQESIKILIKNGLTQADIARLTGVSAQRIEQLLKGRKK